ncbi:MAG: hypothetical protein PF636_11255 [Actinomycetota bacterium]|nr:hypothetical protein [Actinomycetota bacterium]
MSPLSKRIALILVLLAAALLVAGCAKDTITWVDEGASYTVPEAEDLAQQLASDAFADTPVSESDDLRQGALADLRGFGADASELADLLTRSFAQDVRSVPYYAELAEIDGVKAWLVVESWGPSDGTLRSTRLWAFERATGDVILAATVN